MPNQTLANTVAFNYNGGNPTWSVPSPITVNHGDVDTIQWNLSATNLASGMSAKFAATNPVQFMTVKNGNQGDTWTGPGPLRASDSQVTVQDDNRGPSGPNKTYHYGIRVTTTDSNGNSLTWVDDPDVENVGA